MNKFYITTAIPYVNGKPHIGHALEYFQADVIRRYHQLIGDNTLLLSGADENALKNVQTAEKEGVPVQQFLDRNSQVFKEAYEALGVHLDVFQRGSDKEKHWPGVQKLWELCKKNGDIYKKEYEGLYCVGCESFKTESELVDGLCPEHQKKPELVKEENYFFRLSKYQNQLVKIIESNTLQIVPANKRAEALSFIKSGLGDFSVSRSKVRAKGVGVPVPGDSDQIMYVWFDALAIYMTGIGFGADEKNATEDTLGTNANKSTFTEADFKYWWPANVHVIGKDINRFHTVYWPAMLLSAGLPLPKTVLIHSFINAPGGQKMSKSLGNVIDPFDMAREFGLEPFRYYLLSQIPLAEDGEISIERFKEVYSADLANGLGNLVARVARLCEKAEYKTELQPEFLPEIQNFIEQFQFNLALNAVWNLIRKTDQLINQDEPWKVNDREIVTKMLSVYTQNILTIAFNLQPFIPQTAANILEQYTGQVKSQSPLFPRLA